MSRRRRSSKSLLDDLEDFENEASERREEEDAILLEEEHEGVSNDNVIQEEEEEETGDEVEVEYGYEDTGFHEEDDDDVELLYQDEVVVGSGMISQKGSSAVLDTSFRGASYPTGSSLDPLYEDSEDFPVTDTGRSTPSVGYSSSQPDSSAFSLNSDPEVMQGGALSSANQPQQKRPSTISGQSGGSAMPSPTRRDTHRSFRSTRISFMSTSSKRSSSGGGSGGSRQSSRSSLIQAADRLGSAESNSQWENVMAAAAVVAASSQAPVQRSHIQFGRGDYVLVMLTLLNITSPEDVPKILFTVDPVNKSGYPRNEGSTEAHRQGPYSYVLCRVQQVHFEEDQRYYTVFRMDSETEQRADPGWMEPLTSIPAGDNLERAILAAQRTAKSMAEQQAAPKAEPTGGWTKWMEFIRDTLIPFYKTSRAALKQFLRDVMHGEDSYSVQLHITGINILVVCGLIYLFLDILALSFLSPSADKSVAITAIIVWCVLVLELFFEFLIRPSSYFDLIQSDKAYSPSTARHINRFHLFFEACGLILYLPSIGCSFTEHYCWDSIWFNHIDASIQAVKGIDQWEASWSRFSLGLIFLRCFCLLRHWKQRWIIATFKEENADGLFMQRLLLTDKNSRLLKARKQKDEELTQDENVTNDQEKGEELERISSEHEKQLKNAATIGTALMLVNSHRALILGLFIVTVFPIVHSIGLQNPVAPAFVELLQANNIAAPTNSTEDCEFLENAITSWLLTTSLPHVHNDLKHFSDSYLLWAQLLPIRCDWQHEDGVITVCEQNSTYEESVPICHLWKDIQPEHANNATRDYFAGQVAVRTSEILVFEQTRTLDGLSEDFYVRVVFDESNSVVMANFSIFLLLFSLLLLSLVGLSVMRGDADRLVLGPLQRMLKIVVKYADDPLSQTASTAKTSGKNGETEKEQLGNYETEQLINAIAKIADLLRKCWGVAGAGIISSNLARTKDGQTVVFNPTVPGKRVYAFFGFVAINEFGKQLRALDRDVMRLINDVARVVHDEVYRWSLGDSGQCNKNLGAAFLMVFRIGDFSEVHDKKKRATDVVFNSQMKKNIRLRKRQNNNAKRRASSRHFDIGKDGTLLSLASLPGIQNFADRALLGMLKSFAGIHRDRSLVEWQNDFRLGAGVGAFKVNVIYGMDAGWAVEGAVGSEYKIDATYLSPHVNMASRMMSACKQYGVTILLSQAVEELLSKTARKKLRHLDTVYVKGSSVPQRIYTYDARFDGVDFFLFERSPEQADVEADSYNTSIWDTDQDLRSMRQHVTDEFVSKFHEGLELYLEGKWTHAVEALQCADDMMLQTVLEEGYVDYKADDLGGKVFDRRVTTDEVVRIRNEFGDGACKSLVQYMLRRQCIPPKDWHGVRKLMSK